MAAVTLSTFLFIILLCHSLSSSSSDLESLKNFEGYRKGDHGIFPVKRYLNQYGYLDTLHLNNDKFDDELESEIITYQLNYRLDTSGILDSDTLSLMMTPRCGVPDIFNGTNTMKRGTKPLRSFFFSDNPIRWNKSVLLYKFINAFPPEGIDHVGQAFDIWSNGTNIFTFLKFNDDNSDYIYPQDISIGIFRGDHGDGHPFDGPGGKLAHASFPGNSLIHFDADEAWTDGASPGMYDMVSVALHEIGHVLGLGHSVVEDAIMYASIGQNTVKRNLHPDDLDGINALYES